MTAGRSLFLGKDLDTSVQNYINTMRKVGGLVNTTIVMAAANGIVAAKNPVLLTQHGDHIEISKGCVKSLFYQMGYVKGKCSNAGKVTVAHFHEILEEFLADINAEVLMNVVHPQLILNWDKTAIQFVATRQWTMHRAKEKVIPIASSDDKWQISAVLAVTMIGEYLSPQVVYKGNIPSLFPQGWGVWRSDYHWLNEDTMEKHFEKIVVPFLSQKRESLKLEKTSPALASFDCLKGQTTPGILANLESHNIITIQVPANCTDKMQPLDVSLNKPMKDEMKRRFEVWYAEAAARQSAS